MIKKNTNSIEGIDMMFSERPTSDWYLKKKKHKKDYQKWVIYEVFVQWVRQEFVLNKDQGLPGKNDKSV